MAGKLGSENLQQGKVIFQPIRSHNLLECLTNLKCSLLSSYGSKARTKLCCQQDSNDLTVSSSSTVLADAYLSVYSSPTLKLIHSAVKSHMDVHHDFGLFCHTLCMSLICTALREDFSAMVCAAINRRLLQDVIYHLQNCSPPVIKTIDIDNMHQLLKIAQGVLHSKPALQINSEDSEQMCIMLLRAVLGSISDRRGLTEWPVLHFQQAKSMCDSNIYSGVILSLPHYTGGSLKDAFNHFRPSNNMKTLILNLSISPEDLLDNIYVGNMASKNTKVVEEVIQSFGHLVLKHKVSVVLNQKVVCDHLKLYLQSHGVLVLDRIGKQPMNYLEKITIGKIMGHLADDVETCLGTLDKVSMVEIGKKWYVQMQHDSVTLSSVVICYSTSITSKDLQHVVKGTIHALNQALKSKKVCLGGGKTEMYLAGYLLDLYKNNSPPAGIHCSPGQFQTCLNGFCKALHDLGRHLNTNEIVFDCYDAKLNALVVAVQTASLVMEIQFQITEI